MNNILEILKTTFKAKILPIVTRIRLWTSREFIRTRLIDNIRRFFVRILDVKPRHKKDYYSVFNWLISKRLAFAIVVVTILVCASFFFSMKMRDVQSTGGTTIRKYSYNSLGLRFASGRVQITGKGGYLAYEGEVEDGYVTGAGSLFNREGGLVYYGQFVKNCYEGQGTSYYPQGIKQYQGEFANNLYEGEGTLYRDNGSLWYKGAFSRGLMEGQGELFGSSNSSLYKGYFTANRIVYSELLGKTTEQIAQAYQGRRDLYENDEFFVVALKDIQAVYSGAQEQTGLGDSITVDTIYVLEDKFYDGTHAMHTREELENYFGAPIYYGESALEMAEAVCLLEMSITGKSELIQLEKLYDDCFEVTDYNTGKEVYLTSFEKDGLIYTFISEGEGEEFSFYSITQKEEINYET